MTVEEALRTVDHSTRTGDIYRAARSLAAEVRHLRADRDALAAKLDSVREFYICEVCGSAFGSPHDSTCPHR